MVTYFPFPISMDYVAPWAGVSPSRHPNKICALRYSHQRAFLSSRDRHELPVPNEWPQYRKMRVDGDVMVELCVLETLTWWLSEIVNAGYDYCLIVQSSHVQHEEWIE